MADQHSQQDGRAQDEDQLQLLRQSALFAKQQDAETPRAHQHAANGGSYAEPDQQSNENEVVVHSVDSGQWIVNRLAGSVQWHVGAFYPLSTNHYTAGRVAQRPFRAGGIGRAALCHVAIAAATRAQPLHGILHQGTHVIREACSLREDQRRL